MQFKQTIQRDKQSICPKCIHSSLCRAEGNQPCASCNRFVPLEVRPISSEIREMLRFLAEDTTCPLHIAAQIDQILDMDSDKEIFIKWTSVTLRLPNEELEAAKAEKESITPDIPSNQEWLRAMSRDDLTDTIHAFHLGYAPWCDYHCKNNGDDGCDVCIRAWLDKPATEAKKTEAL